MTRYKVMRTWSDGFLAAIGPAACDSTKDGPWQAGYLAGYKMRKAKNEALDEYLISTGLEPQAKIRLCSEGVEVSP